MLKTTPAEISSPTNVRRCTGIGNDGVGDGDKVGEVGRNLSKRKNLLKINLSRMDFLSLETSLAFTHLRKVFIKVPIFHYFGPKRYIQIETDVSGFAIARIFCQMTSEYVIYTNLDLYIFEIGKWHPVAFFSRKMIPTETKYKTHNRNLLTIVKVFKTWYHYLKDCNHKVLILTNHNNLLSFMNTKNSSVK